MVQSNSWRDLAENKRNAIFESIPTTWRLEQSKLPSNEQQRDVTGYIQQFLSKRELEITETDVVGIAKETSAGNWTAAEVTEAFCHRASLAHQLVSDNWLSSTDLISDVASACEGFSPLNCVSGNLHGLLVIRASSLDRSQTNVVVRRRIVSTKHFLMLPSLTPKHSTSTSRRTRNP